MLQNHRLKNMIIITMENCELSSAMGNILETMGNKKLKIESMKLLLNCMRYQKDIG